MNRKLRILLLAFGAIFALLAVMSLFLTHPPAGLHSVRTVGAVSAVGAVSEAEFQGVVRKGMESLVDENTKLKTSYQKVLEDLDRSDKEVKKALEELTKVKNTCNDMTLTMVSLKKLEAAVLKNARSSFADPVEKACADEETRTLLNAMARIALCKMESEYKALPQEWRALWEGKMAKQKSLTGVDTGLGQATVPTETFNEIYDTLLTYGQWNTLGVMRVGMRTVIVPVATARPGFVWVGSGTGGTGEGSTITPQNFTGSSVTLIIQTLASYLTVARELLADSTVDLAPYILRNMSESISQGLDTAAFISTGTADQTNAGYYGIFAASTVNTNCAAVANPGSTTLQATVLDDWVRCLTTVNAEVLTRNPKWWIHPQMLALASLVRDKNGRPIFQTWLEVPKPGSIGSILGYSVIPTAIAPTNNTASQVATTFGDPQGQVVGLRADLELATSADIGFPQNLMAYRTLMRAGVILKTKAASTTLVPFANLTLAAA